MKRSSQKVVVQEPWGGEHLETVRRTVHGIEDYGEYWTGNAVVNGTKYQVKLVSKPGQVDTWYTIPENWQS